MKTIRLAVFNEDYWSKGLIYTQNILPLQKLCAATNSKLEIISFTSFLMYILKYKEIKKFKCEMAAQGVTIKNYYTYYVPTRYMTSWWFNMPLLYFSCMFYILYLRFNDRNKDIIYNLRSYEVSFLFLKLYGRYHNLFFDPRTDWIEENVNSGFFKKGGMSERVWCKIEKSIINKFKKTIFISDVFRENAIEKYQIVDTKKLSLLYNPIDYEKFNLPVVQHKDKVFLYTGSLGAWNKLDTYLDFFKTYFLTNNNSKLIICTSTAKEKVQTILEREQYESIKNKVEVYYNVLQSELPAIYAQCDFGLQLMSKKDSRVGVKFVEYVAAGIIPIVHENVQGAAVLVDKYNLGIIVKSEDNQISINKKINEAYSLDKSSNNYQTFQCLTDLNKILPILEDIYM